LVVEWDCWSQVLLLSMAKSSLSWRSSSLAHSEKASVRLRPPPLPLSPNLRMVNPAMLVAPLPAARRDWEISPRWAIFPLMRTPGVSYCSRDPASFRAITRILREPRKHSMSRDGWELVMFAWPSPMEHSKLSIEPRISSSFHRVNTLHQKSWRIFTFCHHMLAKYLSMETLCNLTWWLLELLTCPKSRN